jgi:hypothetical protein
MILYPNPDSLIGLPKLVDKPLYSTPTEEVTLKSLKDYLMNASGDKIQVRVKLSGGLGMAMHLDKSVHSDRLVVNFHGMRRVPSEKTIAMFFRHDWTQVYKSPILSLSDPMTEGPSPHPGPRSGLYVGPARKPIAGDINKLIDAVCASLRISPSHTILYGASAGAAGAIVVGAQRATGCGVIAVCPLLLLEKVRSEVLESAAMAAGVSKAEFDAILAATPEVVSPMHAMKAGVLNGIATRYFIAQCKEDSIWLGRNFRQLWKFFDLPLGDGGGVDSTGKVAVATYSSVAGHGAEPPELVLPLFHSALRHFNAQSAQPSAEASN